ncbi:hypothetical protein DsansV1_C14g0130461 [Dioscorea sansibarensis]
MPEPISSSIPNLLLSLSPLSPVDVLSSVVAPNLVSSGLEVFVDYVQEMEELDSLVEISETRTLPSALCYRNGADKIREEVENLKVNPSSSASRVLRLQICLGALWGSVLMQSSLDKPLGAPSQNCSFRNESFFKTSFLGQSLRSSNVNKRMSLLPYVKASEAASDLASDGEFIVKDEEA